MTDITLKAGKGNKIQLTYKDSAGVPIDITGATARMMARNSMYSAVVVTKAATISAPATGVILFDFVAADTNSILTTTKEERFIYDIELTLSGEEPTIILSGTLILQQAVTRD